MTRILLLGGLILIVISAIISPHTISQYKVQKSGHLVLVKLLELPNCSSGYKNKYLKLEHEGVQYIQRTKCKYTRDLHSGQSIKMLHADQTNIFLFPSENILWDLISIGMLTIIGILIVLIAIRKKPLRHG